MDMSGFITEPGRRSAWRVNGPPTRHSEKLLAALRRERQPKLARFSYDLLPLPEKIEAKVLAQRAETTTAGAGTASLNTSRRYLLIWVYTSAADELLAVASVPQTLADINLQFGLTDPLESDDFPDSDPNCDPETAQHYRQLLPRLYVTKLNRRFLDDTFRLVHQRGALFLQLPLGSRGGRQPVRLVHLPAGGWYPTRHKATTFDTSLVEYERT